MKLNVSVKQVGTKKPIIKPEEIILDNINSQSQLKDLLEAVVEQQVIAYNRKELGTNLIAYLSKDQIENLSPSGKVGFGDVYNEAKANLLQSQESVLLAFEDGLIAVFVDDFEITQLNQVLNLVDGATITFIRLTFLAGSFW